jgi:hypothetical protein
MSNVLKKIYDKLSEHQAEVIQVKLDDNRKMIVVGDSK